jgi:hypothetical protein
MQFIALIKLDYIAPASMLPFFCREAPSPCPTRPTASKPRDWIHLLRLHDGHVYTSDMPQPRKEQPMLRRKMQCPSTRPASRARMRPAVESVRAHELSR